METTIWLIDDGASHYSDHALTGFSEESDAYAYLKRHFSDSDRARVMQVAVDVSTYMVELRKPVDEWMVRAMGSASNYLSDDYDKTILFVAHAIDSEDEEFYQNPANWPNGIPNTEVPVPGQSTRNDWMRNQEWYLRVKAPTNQAAIDAARPMIEPTIVDAIRLDLEKLIRHLEGLSR